MDDIYPLLDNRTKPTLSNAAMETLAIIAYNQPVTRPFVEQVRGVDCSAVVQGLQQKGLIEEKGRMDLPGRPLLYGTTSNFLRCFGIASLDQLPPLPQSEDNTMRETTLDEMLMEQQPVEDGVFGPDDEPEDVFDGGQEE